MFKKNILILCFILLLTHIPALCEENTNALNGTQNNIEQSVEDTTSYSEEESITTTPMTGEIDSRVKKSPYENNFQEQIPKQNEFTRMIFMFLKTMLAVAVCTIVIFLLLLGVRKFYGISAKRPLDKNEIEDNLKPTQNENEALQVFFNKTKNL